MRIAICFYGLVGSKDKKYGKGTLLDPQVCYNYYKKNVFFNDHELDIFIHSQSYESKDKILKVYNPKLYLIEKQKNFFKNFVSQKNYL